ncbi:hypothetical protein HanXRQr2_Chr11g0475641 [Helianthus annuus]|uniref:Uncharacterized protein n=1 Tax=Helianthus annuus TaxID=4232 RepID=A0A9K3MZC0_HELAN|nr:hypothetical protein HanXRQr2_Chr11g0475641 [Helianthus annuus]
MFNNWFNLFNNWINNWFNLFNNWINMFCSCLFYMFPCCLIVIRRRTFRILSISYCRHHVGWTFFSGTVLRGLCVCV